MKRFPSFPTLLLTIALALPLALSAQYTDPLPKGFAPGEREQLPAYLHTRSGAGITTPPPGPLRTMPEWEELEYLAITWTSYSVTLREIVRHAVAEVKVIIVCNDSNTVKNALTNGNVPLANVRFLEAPFNSVWIRDYGPNCVYQTQSDSLVIVDWIYNRPRPLDDAVPEAIATYTGLPLYSTSAAPEDLVHTGGNFHVDGLGTAFSSELVLDENAVGNSYGVTAKSSADIDSIMQRFMGIERYIKMPTLPYDGIHHIDMHWRLLDEETLLVGQYPTGIADGPQIEANLQYVLANHMSPFGTPYRVVRIPMPPDGNNQYPNQGFPFNPGDYRTYTNNVFVNKTLLLPVYAQQYDTTAIRILQAELPGFQIKGIDCNQIIQASGALHCVTREIGVDAPLRIVHQRLRDTYDTQSPYPVQATATHRSGIVAATLHWTTDTTQGFAAIPMSPMAAPDTWGASIPAQPAGTRVFYYISAQASSGKVQARPITAPDGWWRFDVLNPVQVDPAMATQHRIELPFPNPARALTCVPVQCGQACSGRLSLRDVSGRHVMTLHEGFLPAGSSKHFLDASKLAAGAYLLQLDIEGTRHVQRLMVH